MACIDLSEATGALPMLDSDDAYPADDAIRVNVSISTSAASRRP